MECVVVLFPFSDWLVWVGVVGWFWGPGRNRTGRRGGGGLAALTATGFSLWGYSIIPVFFLVSLASLPFSLPLCLFLCLCLGRFNLTPFFSTLHSHLEVAGGCLSRTGLHRYFFSLFFPFVSPFFACIHPRCICQTHQHCASKGLNHWWGVRADARRRHSICRVVGQRFGGSGGRRRIGRRGNGLAVRHHVYVDVGGAAGWTGLVLGVGLAVYRYWTWIDKPVVDLFLRSLFLPCHVELREVEERVGSDGEEPVCTTMTVLFLM